MVVMALGANSWVRPIDVQRALALLGPKRTLAITTHRTWFGKPGPDTQTIRGDVPAPQQRAAPNARVTGG